MHPSARIRFIVPFVAILGLFSLFASEGSGDPHPKGKGDPMVILRGTATPLVDAFVPKVTETATFALG